MTERPYILLIAMRGNITNYAATLQKVRDTLPGKVELLFTYQNGAAIGFTSEISADKLKTNVQLPLKDVADMLICELAQDWSAIGFNVAYRWLRGNVHDSSLRSLS